MLSKAEKKEVLQIFDNLFKKEVVPHIRQCLYSFKEEILTNVMDEITRNVCKPEKPAHSGGQWSPYEREELLKSIHHVITEHCRAFGRTRLAVSYEIVRRLKSLYEIHA